MLLYSRILLLLCICTRIYIFMVFLVGCHVLICDCNRIHKFLYYGQPNFNLEYSANTYIPLYTTFPKWSRRSIYCSSWSIFYSAHHKSIVSCLFLSFFCSPPPSCLSLFLFLKHTPVQKQAYRQLV